MSSLSHIASLIFRASWQALILYNTCCCCTWFCARTGKSNKHLIKSLHDPYHP